MGSRLNAAITRCRIVCVSVRNCCNCKRCILNVVLVGLVVAQNAYLPTPTLTLTKPQKIARPVISNNNIVSAWSDCLNQLQLHHVKEPRERYVNSESRSDIVVFELASGGRGERDLELDIVLAHVWNNEIEVLFATTLRQRPEGKICRSKSATMSYCWKFLTNICAYSLQNFWLL